MPNLTAFFRFYLGLRHDLIGISVPRAIFFQYHIDICTKQGGSWLLNHALYYCSNQ